MTQARLHVAPPGQQSLHHCQTRCVRRAWLCGVDPLTKIDHQARKAMMVARIDELGSIFSMRIYGYAVVSNHLHVVIAVESVAATKWEKDEVIALYETGDPGFGVRKQNKDTDRRTEDALQWLRKIGML